MFLVKKDEKTQRPKRRIGVKRSDFLDYTPNKYKCKLETNKFMVTLESADHIACQTAL